MQIKKTMFALMAVAGFAVAGHSVAAETQVSAESPVTLTGATIVTAEQAKKAIDSGAQIFDLRTPTEFAEGSVKGAVNLPYKEKSAKSPDFDGSQDSFDLSKLPADRSTPLVLHCTDQKCWKSYKGAALAVKAGHKKVMVMRGGWPEWKSKGYPIQ